LCLNATSSASPNYPHVTDTNNLSLVLFLHCPGLSIVFPGDLEKPGWRNLLLRPDFQAHLARVNIFVASHHGRENGYLPEVFDYCHPQVIIISDESKQYETQETNYSNRASGIVWNATDTRKVLTTRKDGGSVQD
jgi:beta-lactamase superfamily II metal-dependent hydrolase